MIRFDEIVNDKEEVVYLGRVWDCISCGMRC